MLNEGNPQIIFRFFSSVNILKYYVEALTNEDPKLIINSLDNMYDILELA